MNARPAFKAFIFLLLMLLLNVGLSGCVHDDDNGNEDAPPAASSDAELSALSVSEGALDPGFSSDVTDYAVTVGNAVTEITVTATASDAAATLTVDGAATDSGAASAPIDLAVGTTQIDVVVTAEDGTTKTYRIAVTREASSDATLSALALSAAALNETFDPATTAYTADVGNDVDSTTVTATANDDAATLEIDGTPTDSGTASDPIALAVGDNAITVTVTAGDGATTETYTITVTRAEPPVRHQQRRGACPRR
ncbi:MAG: cadherin-like beta sandwich domain-containing protein [Woeseiaceae bacterium]|nr:cadherin-like beta sandwich domain-containing protein [Woeseiaceae bacterium]